MIVEFSVEQLAQVQQCFSSRLRKNIGIQLSTPVLTGTKQREWPFAFFSLFLRRRLLPSLSFSHTLNRNTVLVHRAIRRPGKTVSDLTVRLQFIPQGWDLARLSRGQTLDQKCLYRLHLLQTHRVCHAPVTEQALSVSTRIERRAAAAGWQPFNLRVLL